MTYFWRGDVTTIAQDEAGIKACLATLDQPCYVLDVDGYVGFTNAGDISTGTGTILIVLIKHVVYNGLVGS